MAVSKRKIIRHILFLVLLPQLVQADAMENVGEVLGPILVILINIPTVIAFFILKYNLSKTGRALIINSLIWIVYMLPFTDAFITWQENNFTTENYFIDSLVGLLTWLPISIVFLFTAILYWNSKTKKDNSIDHIR